MKNYISSSFLLGLVTGLCFAMGLIILAEGLKYLGWIRQPSFTGREWTGLVICIPFFFFAAYATRTEWKA